MAFPPLPAGATIGILGGGQLGRMMAMAAAQLGYKCHIFAPEADSVAAEVAAFFTHAEWDDADSLAQFASTCDVITYEFENVPVAPLLTLDQGKLAPCPKALEIAQDRLSEKTFITDLGGTPAPFKCIDSTGHIAGTIDAIGAPGIIKTRRDGYDGKGQWKIAAEDTIPEIAIPDGGLIYEGFVGFACEFSVIMVRGRDGAVRFWDSAHNTHESGILAHSVLPAPAIVGEQVEEARALAQKAAEALDYVGVLTCEFFATAAGPVFNEMAPRVHNSGHWTIEGAVTSQFENHIRAIAGQPLGDTSCTAKRIVMDNLIGAEALKVTRLLSDPGAHLHLYGKAEAREGRKMGHVTRVGRPAREVLFVVARSTNGCIAKDGDVPWQISTDLKRFKALTMGMPMVMGRKTFEALPGLLPRRRHIVLTRDPEWSAEGAEVAHSVDDALALVGEGDFSVIGGAEIFALLADYATAWEITEVHEETQGEVYMPLPSPDEWFEASRERHPADERWPAYDFVTYRRREAACG